FCSVLFLAMPHQLLHAYIIPYMKYHLDISILHTKKDCPQSFDCQQSGENLNRDSPFYFL
ncbi:hypothetical protein, partial [Sharpea azabuensis]|uniref:hypothetical protein n=1 Tax=Sharpea azabuensis TaxID=322505 RepID=UPI00240A7FB8